MRGIVHTLALFFMGFLFFVLPCRSSAQENQQESRKNKARQNSKVSAEKQADSYFDVSAPKFEDFVYKPSIKTVLFHREGWELSPPLIKFNTDERLMLSFDDLDADYKVWQYTVIHCDATWNPTDLWPNEYIDGFTDGFIRDYKFSFNTLQPFTHYSLQLPNDDFRFTLPGNYILKIYPENEPEKPVITRRFMVVDAKVTIKGRVKRSGNPDLYFSHQEVPFSIFNPTYNIAEPMRNLNVVILQNNRWDNAIWGLKPMMLRSDELDFQYTDGANTFEAGNEFRYFDIKSLRYNSERIRAIENRNDGYHVALLPDVRRTFKPYVTYSDINGRMLIKTEDARETTTEAEYVWVDFFLPVEAPFADGSVYILGALTDWSFKVAQGDKEGNPDGKMKYNFARQGYEARLYLKQGYYNYLYAFVPNGESKAEMQRLEGSLFETRNAYTVLVYYREPGARFDRLIAAEVIEN